MDRLQLKKMLKYFFQEDIGTGDLTSQAIFSGHSCEAFIIAKSNGIFAGGSIIKEGYALIDKEVRTVLKKKMEIRCVKETPSLH